MPEAWSVIIVYGPCENQSFTFRVSACCRSIHIGENSNLKEFSFR